MSCSSLEPNNWIDFNTLIVTYFRFLLIQKGCFCLKLERHLMKFSSFDEVLLLTERCKFCPFSESSGISGGELGLRRDSVDITKKNDWRHTLRQSLQNASALLPSLESFAKLFLSTQENQNFISLKTHEAWHGQRPKFLTFTWENGQAKYSISILFYNIPKLHDMSIEGLSGQTSLADITGNAIQRRPDFAFLWRH